MAITEDNLESIEDDSSVGPLERAIEDLADLVEAKLMFLATAAGSYLMGYARYLGLMFIKAVRIAVRTWLTLVPFFALGAVGEYLLWNFPFYTLPGVAGLFLMIGPAALTASAFALLPRTSLSEGHDDAALEGRQHLNKRMFVVPLTKKGYRFWTFGVVGGAVVMTLAIEIGWLSGIWPLADIHNTMLAFPNVWPLDLIVTIANAIASLAGVNG